MRRKFSNQQIQSTKTLLHKITTSQTIGNNAFLSYVYNKNVGISPSWHHDELALSPPTPKGNWRDDMGNIKKKIIN